MIVDPTSSQTSMSKDNTNEHDEHAQLPPQAPPPSYEAVVANGGHVSGQYVPESAAKAQDVKVPILPTPSSYQVAGPPPSQAGQPPATVVYNYVNPMTGERIVSLLPPDHPQMVCLQQGGHITESKFGILGILAAIIWFPLGIGLCLLDRKVYCKRCGAILDDGMC
ncbi:hypothetical protein L226DRAFT_546123 [Lentinus tigrinus ALCF2SS1-7]|uniref:Uncharacterized protein n=1 Tax=Lentinus tigrinus ALCF2SS1-6 TaxID=1328759 RepID=A0A5C2SA11_9APHY|nr:hypothetical protein L227DRAFT_119237 [Lentinus tigrinus ALCF2SS1-6]RPD74203.1 hypothetical protein L226DRAFT_546123 [Lentinus tigrinus ALCF2SS1-7]